MLATISRYRMFQPGQYVGVAVSGGADSVALLHILLELAPSLGIRLAVLHLDHMLRGDESRGDAEFVRDLAAKFDLSFHLHQVDVGRMSDNLEQAARSARYEFFGQFLISRTHRVALGHTRSDQAETVLFRFLRGAGTAGLAGIRPVTSDGCVRPLIDVDRATIEAWLRERGIDWREDSTNHSTDFARNRIRHELLPQLTRDWNPESARDPGPHRRLGPGRRSLVGAGDRTAGRPDPGAAAGESCWFGWKTCALCSLRWHAG